jgi:antitoxin component YwqK of YwqJK toxin-antitoxin module
MPDPVSTPDPQPEKLLIKDDAGKLTHDSTMLGGNLHGETVLYNHGRVSARLQFQNGKQEGEAIYYDDLGQVTMRSFYHDGKQDGETTYFDQTGKIVRKATYAAGQLNGRMTDYYPASGKAREVSHYKDGLLDGDFFRFAADGKLEERICYRKGRKVQCPPQVTLSQPAAKR